MPLDGRPDIRVRAVSRLSAIKVTKLKAPGLYEDGAGLRLIVTDKVTKRWALRLTINGRRVERGLGVWPDVSLDYARRKASAMRVAAKDGRDLKTELRAMGQQKAVSFKVAFEAFFEIRRQKLSNDKHVKQRETTMQTYVIPVIGKRPVSEITAAELLTVI